MTCLCLWEAYIKREPLGLFSRLTMRKMGAVQTRSQDCRGKWSCLHGWNAVEGNGIYRGQEFAGWQMEIGKMLGNDVVLAEKKALRKAVLAVRDALSGEERRKGALLLTERILGHQWFYGAEELLCFVSYGSEIDTGEIIREALRAGKKVYVPKVLQGGKEASQHKEEEHSMEKENFMEEEHFMEFFRIQDLNRLKAGYRGILEPAGDSERYICTAERAECTLVLMPGAAFDSLRNRIGYGGGFYDRYLAGREALQLRTVAVGFRCQMVEEIPAESTDIKPCQVICV